jgi:hypothetical protein
MAHYSSRGRLYFRDTREQAGEAAVQRWAELTQDCDPRQVALIADASAQRGSSPSRSRLRAPVSFAHRRGARAGIRIRRGLLLLTVAWTMRR